MKLMKHITIALVLCAIPAMAFGQTVFCDDCTHAVSVYMGGGGLIATADDAEMVTYVASCGGVTRSGELAANADGVVSMLFEGDLACHTAGDNNGLELGPVMDGGWYWITDETNSAVGNLVSKDILDNDMVDITDAGDSVTTMMGKGAVYLKHDASGRVGILPNILPEPPMEALRLCGADDRGATGTSAVAVANAANARFVRRMSKCALGDGGTITLATTTNTFSGATTQVPDKGTVVRPSGTGSVVVTVDLWGNHSGHFTTAADAHALLGNPAIATGTLRGVGRLTGVTYTARLGSGPTGAAFTAGTAAGGITMDNTTTTNVVTFTIAADTAYCSSTNNNAAPVSVTALMTDATSATQVTPARARVSSGAAEGTVGSTSFTVVCGSSSSSANQGQELVPENPFPTE